MRYNGVVQRKLTLLSKQIVKIMDFFAGVSYSEFESSWEKRCVAERSLQVAVEIVIDTSERIIAIEKAGPVSTSAEAIERLVSLKILESKEPYVDMVRFRNLIVHQYEEINPELLYTLVTKKLSDFRQFIDEIDRAN